MEQTTNLIFAGVGGQGVLLIAEVAALAALAAGHDVKQTEVHGVSQRGGSVESHVRFGPAVHSPLVSLGQADVVIGLEKLEALRFASFLRMDGGGNGRWLPDAGVLLVNDHEIIPGSVAGAAEKYPHQALDGLRARGVRVMALAASECARDLGDGRAANTVMLGALSALVPQVPLTLWRATLSERLQSPGRQRDLNLRAFEAGRDLAHGARQVG